jgi:hypothetical protein
MMHRGAKRIYRATKNLSRSQELEYWRLKASQLLPSPTEPARNGGAARKQRKVM